MFVHWDDGEGYARLAHKLHGLPGRRAVANNNDRGAVLLGEAHGNRWSVCCRLHAPRYALSGWANNREAPPFGARIHRKDDAPLAHHSL